MPFPQLDQQVRLLLNVLPHVMSEKKFALKGGTAINFFLRDMPLSVDIDLTYLPIADRATSLATMSASLEAIAAKISSSLPGVRIQRDRDSVSKRIRTLRVHRAGVTIKVEPNQILRGSIFPCQEQNTSAVSNGAHTLTAIAQDPAGNQGTSAAVTVTVSNSTGTRTPTLVWSTVCADSKYRY